MRVAVGVSVNVAVGVKVGVAVAVRVGVKVGDDALRGPDHFAIAGDHLDVRRVVIRMLKVGESTGELDQALGNISYFYTRDIDESVGKVQALIEPVLTVVMGLLLAWIMLAVLGPIYDTVAHIKL